MLQKSKNILRFKNISSSTASRDLKMAVEKKIIFKSGDKRTTQYKYAPQRKYQGINP